MSSNDSDDLFGDGIDDYYDDDEETYDGAAMNYEKLGLDWPRPLMAPVRFYVEGELGGDIKWNNIDAKIQLQVPYRESNRAEYERNQKYYGTSANPYECNFSCRIRPFTHNCGAKTIEDIYCSSYLGRSKEEETKLFLQYVESFLWHCCNVGILLGSDSNEEGHMGSTGKIITTYGTGYTVLDSVWNPNYTWAKEHKIFLFYKNLGEHVHTDHWS